MPRGAGEAGRLEAAADRLWIVVGDIHDETGNFFRIPELGQAAGVIVSGDLTVNGGVELAARVMAELEKAGLPVLAQIGNMDRPEVDAWLSEKGANLHLRVLELAPDVAVFGVGGSTITPFSTPSEFTEDEVAQWLESLWRQAGQSAAAVLVSHNPPRDTACDDLGNGVHVGSTAVRKFIEAKQPAICLCGHIHEGKAADSVGGTVIVNPGPLAEGGYALLRLKDGALSAELCQVPDELRKG